MSFHAFLTDTATVSRNAPTKDASGGQSDVWTNIFTTIKCKVWNTGSTPIDTAFLQRQFKGKFLIAFESNLALKPKDRILVSGSYYEVHQDADFSHSAISSITVYMADCSLRTV